MMNVTSDAAEVLRISWDDDKKPRSWLSIARAAQARLWDSRRLVQIDQAAAKSANGTANRSIVVSLVWATLNDTQRSELTTDKASNEMKQLEVDQHVAFIYELTDALSATTTSIVPFKERTFTVNGSAVMEKYPGATCLAVAVSLWRSLHHAIQTERADTKKKFAALKPLMKYAGKDAKIPASAVEAYSLGISADAGFSAAIILWRLDSFLTFIPDSDLNDPHIEVDVEGSEFAVELSNLFGDPEITLWHEHLLDRFNDVFLETKREEVDTLAKSLYIGLPVFWITGDSTVISKPEGKPYSGYLDKSGWQTTHTSTLYDALLPAVRHFDANDRQVLLWPKEFFASSYLSSKFRENEQAKDNTLTLGMTFKPNPKAENYISHETIEPIEIQSITWTSDFSASPSLRLRHLNYPFSPDADPLFKTVDAPVSASLVLK